MQQAGSLILQPISEVLQQSTITGINCLGNIQRKSLEIRANKQGDQIQQSKSIKTLNVILPLLLTSVKKVMKNMCVKEGESNSL